MPRAVGVVISENDPGTANRDYWFKPSTREWFELNSLGSAWVLVTDLPDETIIDHSHPDLATKVELGQAIDDIELLPGPQGETGPQGPAGADGSDGFPQILIALWQDAALSAWTNMPAALTEFRNILNTRTKIDLTTATQSRVIARVGTAPVANAKIKVQYSAGESAWTDLCSVTMPATANKTNVGDWTNIPGGAKADVFLRVVGIDGNGTTDPTFGLITLGVK